MTGNSRMNRINRYTVLKRIHFSEIMIVCFPVFDALKPLNLIYNTGKGVQVGHA